MLLLLTLNLQVESRYLVRDATPEAEVTYAMTSTPCAWRDSAHARPDIHRSPASAVNSVYFKPKSDVTFSKFIINSDF